MFVQWLISSAKPPRCLPSQAWTLFVKRLDKIVQLHAEATGHVASYDDEADDEAEAEVAERRQSLPVEIARRLKISANWVAGNAISLREGRGKQNLKVAQAPYGMVGLFRCVLFK